MIIIVLSSISGREIVLSFYTQGRSYWVDFNGHWFLAGAACVLLQTCSVLQLVLDWLPSAHPFISAHCSTILAVWLVLSQWTAPWQWGLDCGPLGLPYRPLMSWSWSSFQRWSKDIVSLSPYRIKRGVQIVRSVLWHWGWVRGILSSACNPSAWIASTLSRATSYEVVQGVSSILFFDVPPSYWCVINRKTSSVGISLSKWKAFASTNRTFLASFASSTEGLQPPLDVSSRAFA